MAVITSVVVGVVGAAVAVKGSQDAKKAQKAAAAEQRGAALQSANVIAGAGAAGEKDILAGQQEAARALAAGTVAAEAEISPFTAASGGFDVAKAMTLSGLPLTGPVADSIRLAAVSAADNPALLTGGDVTQRAIQNQGDLAVSAATPAATQALLTQGAQGIGAIGDVASIRQRGFAGLSDIASQSAAGRASTLVGQTPGLLQLASAGQEARLLGDVAGQRADSRTAEILAKAAGRLF